MKNKEVIMMKYGMDIIGTKIIGDFGAMIPLWEGKVVEAYSRCSPEVKIEWDNGSYSWMMISNINSAPSVNGSSIGYYTEVAYYA